VQGSAARRTARIAIATLFVVAFLTGSLVTFGAVSGVAAGVGVSDLPLPWRVGFATAGLVLLACADVTAMARRAYCPLGWRRQTPRVLLQRHPIPVVAAVWGFDTGLMVTTFRVAAISWGALLLAALGLSSAWAGVGYGLGFALPFLALLFRPRLRRCAMQAAPADPGLERMLRQRSVIQGLSAACLVASGAALITMSTT